jgi:branched-chain amino acid transport system ATP-binding protein
LSDTQLLATGTSVPAAGDTLLRVENVTLRFGGVVALDGVDFELRRGEILGLIGPNGAGKTTCFNAMTGVYTPTSGRITFDGVPISGRKRHRITRLGIARTFQNIRLFPELTALENVQVGVDSRHRTSVVGTLLPLWRLRRRPEEFRGHPRWHGLQRLVGISRFAREQHQSRTVAYDLLKFVGIAHRAGDAARNLPYGDQRRLEIARALATDPKLLCLDEPAAGFNPAEKERLLDLIRSIRDRGVTVLIIEHDMRLVMGVTDRIVVLEFGRKIAEGTPAEIRDDAAVIAAYLGVPDNA